MDEIFCITKTFAVSSTFLVSFRGMACITEPDVFSCTSHLMCLSQEASPILHVYVDTQCFVATPWTLMFYYYSSVVDNGPTFLVCWECCGQDIIIISEGQFYFAVQNQEAVTCYFSRKWLLPFGFTDSIADCHWFVGPGRRWTDEGIVLWNLTNFPRVTEFLPS